MNNSPAQGNQCYFSEKKVYYYLRGAETVIEQNICVSTFLILEVYRNLEKYLQISSIYAGALVHIPNNYTKRDSVLLNRSTDWSEKV